MHIVESLAVGGTERLVTGYINDLDIFKHIVVALHPPKELEPVIWKAEVVYLSELGATGFFSYVKKLNSFIRSKKPALVHSHLWYSTLVARVAVPATIPLLFSIHSPLGKDAFDKSQKALWAERLTVRRRHHLLAISQTVLDDYLSYIPFKGSRRILYNFVDDRFWNRTTPLAYVKGNTLRCVVMANLKPVKNIGFVLAAITRLKGFNIQLDIYGDGSLRDELQTVIDREQLSARLCGVTHDAASVLKNYDLFISASLFEGFGIGVAEAMAMKLPVVLSDIPAHRELALDHAYYFNITSSNELPDLLQQFIRGEANPNRYTEAAFLRARSISSRTNYLEDLQNLYLSLTGFNT